MIRHLIARLGVASTVAALMLSALAAPAAAANPIRWVDDDAVAGDGPNACDTAGYSSIQDAIDDSESWDHVYVCPGTYHEQLLLDVKGIDVRSMPGRSAHIVPPSPLAIDGVGAVVRMTAWAARLVGFRIDIPAGEPPIIVNSSRPSGAVTRCSHVDVAVLALGERERVRRNVIDSIGDATYSGSCGYDYGIVFQQRTGPPALVPPYDLLPVGRAVRNVVRDFKVGGILVEGNAIDRVDRNTVEYLHADDPGCGILVSISPCDILINARPSAVNSGFPQSFGIGAEDNGTALIESNTVTSNFGSGPTINVSGNTLYWGIALIGANSDSVIVSNTVTAVEYGIASGGSLVISPPVRASALGVGGAAIYDNTITDGGTGMDITDDGHVIYGNESHTNVLGIQVSGIDNDIHDNDFRTNAIYDCLDNSPAGSGTASTSNQWTNDLGNTDQPDGICIADD
jgi:hypothetical protein